MNNQIDITLNNYTVRAKEILKRTAMDIIEISIIAHEVRSKYGYQQYAHWVKNDLGLSVKQGERFLNVYDKFGTDIMSVDLDIAPTALYLLSAPSTPEEVRQEAIEIAQSGEQITAKVAKELKEKEAELEKLRAELTKSKEPNLNNLIPELKAMLDAGEIMPPVARNYSQLNEDCQKAQVLVENTRIRALENWKRLELEKAELEKSVDDKAKDLAEEIKKDLQAEIDAARKEVAQAKIDAKDQLAKSIQKEVEAKYQKDLDKEKKAREKAEREAKQSKESMAAAHKETRTLEIENENLKRQDSVVTPTNVDNKWASVFEMKSKDLIDSITTMSNEMDRAGGHPTASIEVLVKLLGAISEALDILEGNKIIEIN